MATYDSTAWSTFKEIKLNLLPRRTFHKLSPYMVSIDDRTQTQATLSRGECSWHFAVPVF